MLPSQGTSQSPDDEKILEYAAELFGQIGITKPNPDTVVWDDNMDSDRVSVVFGEVRLPRSMMSKLTAEDWRPLLAPSIIYNYVLSRDKNRGSLTRVVLPVGLGEIPLVYALLTIFRLTNQDYSRTLLITTVTLWTVFTVSLMALNIRWLWRTISYKADWRAANIIGKQALIAALAKYGQTISVTGYPRKRLHLWPTVRQRIERLQKAKA